MADAFEKTEKKRQQIEKKLTQIYTKSQKDVTKAWKAYMKDIDKEIKPLQEAYEKAKAEGSENVKTLGKKLGRLKRDKTIGNDYYKGMIDKTTKELASVNQTALAFVNDQMPWVYSVNYNDFAQTGIDMGFAFNLVDESVVRRMVMDGDIKLPKKKVDIPKDQRWNTKKLNSSVLQGIVNGESIPKIAERIKPVIGENESACIRNARTMVTGAENAGKNDSYKRAEDMGIQLVEVWLATPDGRTRDTHIALDGEEKKVGDTFSNGLEYPGDPSGDPSEVYNCRCRMIAQVEGVKYNMTDTNERWSRLDTGDIEDWRTRGISYTDKGKSYDERLKDDIKKAEDSLFLLGKDFYSIELLGRTRRYDLKDFADSEEIEDLRKGLPELAKKAEKKGGKLAEDLKEKLEVFQEYEKKAEKYEKLVKEIEEKRRLLAELDAVNPKAVERMMSYIDNCTDIALSKATAKADSIKDQVEEIARRFKITENEVRSAASDGLRRIIEESDFTMRIKGENLQKVLDGGYFKNQFETGTSGGAFAPDRRKKLENRMFNVPVDSSINDADRPVYGMFCPRYDETNDSIVKYYMSGPGSWYGDGVTVVLKRESVINNATMTIGDSLDYDWQVVGTEVNNPAYAGSHGDEEILKKLVNIGRDKTAPSDLVKSSMIDMASFSDEYFEYQLHGRQAHSADNIREVLFNNEYSGSDKLRKMLDDRGIPWRNIK